MNFGVIFQCPNCVEKLQAIPMIKSLRMEEGKIFIEYHDQEFDHGCRRP